LSLRKGQSIFAGNIRITFNKLKWYKATLCVDGSEITIRKCKAVKIKSGIILKLCYISKAGVTLGIRTPQGMLVVREEEELEDSKKGDKELKEKTGQHLTLTYPHFMYHI
jgi:hypothetical protein